MGWCTFNRYSKKSSTGKASKPCSFPGCGKQFASEAGLKVHYTRIHGLPPLPPSLLPSRNTTRSDDGDGPNSLSTILEGMTLNSDGNHNTVCSKFKCCISYSLPYRPLKARTMSPLRIVNGSTRSLKAGAIYVALITLIFLVVSRLTFVASVVVMKQYIFRNCAK